MKLKGWASTMKRILLAIIAVTALATTVTESAQLSNRDALKACSSGTPTDRVLGCSVIIDRRLPGMSLTAALDGRCGAYNDLGQFQNALSDCRAAISYN